MIKFLNQTIGSFDDASHEYVSVWWNENRVSRFSFHSVGSRDVMKNYHRLHGIQVEARYVWAATKAFNTITNVMAIGPDGQEYYVHWVGAANGEWEEFRVGGKYGPAIARMEKTGYVQEKWHGQVDPRPELTTEGKPDGQ